MMSPRVSHRSPVFEGLILSDKTDFFNRTSIRNIVLRRANTLKEKKTTHVLLYPLRLEYSGKLSRVAIEQHLLL